MAKFKRGQRAGANKMAISLKRGERVALEQIDVFADGVAIKRAGGRPARLHARRPRRTAAVMPAARFPARFPVKRRIC
jgi:threonine dehydratase